MIHLRPSREHDKAIMDAIRALGPIPDSQIKALNRVRCCLQLFFLSDVATGDGHTIHPSHLQQSIILPSQWKWHHERPTTSDEKIWHRYLSSLLNTTSSFPQPLGAWLTQSHVRWKWLYSRSTDRIYELVDDSWHLYDRQPHVTRHSSKFTYVDTSTSQPFNIVPTTVKTLHDGTLTWHGVVSDNDYFHLPKCTDPPALDFWVLKECPILTHCNQEWLLEGLYNGTLWCVCDRSYKSKQHSTAVTVAWVFASHLCIHKLLGKVAVSSLNGDAYRGELLGIYAVLSTLLFLEQSHPDHPPWQLRVGCDNEKAGWMSGLLHQHTLPKTKHADLVTAIRRIQSILHTEVTFYHLYGHQDTSTPTHLLPPDAQLNVLVDSVAQTHLDECILQDCFIRQPIYTYEGWHIKIGGVKLQDSIRRHLHRWIDKHRLRQYLYNRGLVSWTVFPQIDWEPLEAYMSKQSQSFQLWFSKHWTNFNGIGTKMKQMGYWKDDLCPCCKKVPESSTTHLFLCDDSTISALREKEFGNILLWLEKVDTSPTLLHIIQSFWHGKPPAMDADDSWVYRSLYNTMRELGVSGMWMGLLPLNLVHLQDQYYNMIRSRRNGAKWAVDFVGCMLRATHKLWLQRNNLLHARTEAGLKGYTLIDLTSLVQDQYTIGVKLMSVEDHYLMDVPISDLLNGSVENIRGWLCSVLIARGDLEAAQHESIDDRGVLSHQLPRLTAGQTQALLDWRRVCLHSPTL